MTLDKTKELFRTAGPTSTRSHKAATRKDFKPVALNAKATFHVRNEVREIQSKNVSAKLEGSDPTLKDEYVIYTAHWDHLGKDTTLKGDQIFNGALDNASGIARAADAREGVQGAADAARAVASSSSRSPPRRRACSARSTTPTHPLYPLNKTLADINMDVINLWGKTKDLTIVGYGNSTLDDLLGSVLASQGGRTVKPDPEPEKGFFYRSDHFEFAKQGVPALYTDAGTEYIGKDSTYGQKKRDEYTENDYHKPSDEVKPDWDLSGRGRGPAGVLRGRLSRGADGSMAGVEARTRSSRRAGTPCSRGQAVACPMHPGRDGSEDLTRITRMPRIGSRASILGSAGHEFFS